MSYQSGAAAVLEQTCVEKLAQLFSHASPVRIAIRLVTSSVGRRRLQEQTIIEFRNAHEVLFASDLPLEFEERVRLVNADRCLDVEATVVAVRYHEGRKAVAARFVSEIENWIIQP
jgi:hypothetical protein